MGGAPDTGGDTAGSGGEFTGFSTIDEFPTPLPAAEPVIMFPNKISIHNLMKWVKKLFLPIII